MASTDSPPSPPDMIPVTPSFRRTRPLAGCAGRDLNPGHELGRLRSYH